MTAPSIRAQPTRCARSPNARDPRRVGIEPRALVTRRCQQDERAEYVTACVPITLPLQLISLSRGIPAFSGMENEPPNSFRGSFTVRANVTWTAVECVSSTAAPLAGLIRNVNVRPAATVRGQRQGVVTFDRICNRGRRDGGYDGDGCDRDRKDEPRRPGHGVDPPPCSQRAGRGRRGKPRAVPVDHEDAGRVNGERRHARTSPRWSGPTKQRSGTDAPCRRVCRLNR